VGKTKLDEMILSELVKFMKKTPYWIMDQMLRESGLEARNPDIMGMHLEWGTKWAHVNAVVKNSRSFTMLEERWSQMADKMREIAEKAEGEDHKVTALGNYFLASMYYCSAQWSIWEDSEELEAYHKLKNECYDKVIDFCPYPMERIEIPFGNKSLPAVLHLPSREGKFPLVVSIPGMDQTKEQAVNVLNNRYVKRGIACLAVDGPGQGESLAVRKIRVQQDSFNIAGRAVMDTISKHKSIQPDKIAVFGLSMGSYWATGLAASDDRYISCSVAAACVEPGMQTIFGQSYPPFRLRFMYMTGIEDDDEFDEFASKMTLEGVAEKIRQPYLFVAGKHDQLCPVKYHKWLYERIKAPKLFMVYDGEFHSLGRVASEAFDFIADWNLDRLNNRPFESAWIEIPSGQLLAI
jgi:pimeloyl-ACP methyl ester carboxylesterase